MVARLYFDNMYVTPLPWSRFYGEWSLDPWDWRAYISNIDEHCKHYPKEYERCK